MGMVLKEDYALVVRSACFPDLSTDRATGDLRQFRESRLDSAVLAVNH